MKTVMAVLLTGAALVAITPAFAGRDESQMMQLQLAIAKQKADSLARAQQAQTGLAGPTGVTGKIGAGTRSPAARRDPTSHP